jgi:hypothetical protein
MPVWGTADVFWRSLGGLGTSTNMQYSFFSQRGAFLWAKKRQNKSVQGKEG